MNKSNWNIYRRGVDKKRPLKEIGQSNQLILREAEKCGIEWERLKFTDIYRLKLENEEEFFHMRTPSTTSAAAVYICKKKRITRNILSRVGLSVVKGYMINREDSESYINSVFDDLCKPVVIKPNDSSEGNGVHINIMNKDEYEQVVQNLFEDEDQLLVEEMFIADEFRILTTRNKVIGVIKRIPANVVGDGVSTIEQLVRMKNSDPKRKQVGTLCPLVLDSDVDVFLEKQKLDLYEVLDEGKQVFLREHSPLDISLGGDTVDVTSLIHKSVEDIALKTIRSIPGLSWAGIDLKCHNIQKELNSDSYRIIEVNSSPMLDWQQYPYVGDERNVAREFLKVMFEDLD